jgi:hypothetical protein
MVDYIGACPICHGNRAAYPQAPSGQQAEPTELLRLFDLYGANLQNNAMAQACATRDKFRAELAGKQADPTLREALEFYANPSNWTSCSSLERGPLMDEDEGDRARAALAGQQSERTAPAGLTTERIQKLWVEHGLDECDPEGFARIIEREVLASQTQRPAPAGQAVIDAAVTWYNASHKSEPEHELAMSILRYLQALKDGSNA